jgi:hypothetical protein
VDAAHIRRPLGAVLLDEGLLTADQLRRALAEQEQVGRPLGQVIVELGFASAPAIALALADQKGGFYRSEHGVSIGFGRGDVTLAEAVSTPSLSVVPPPVSTHAAPKRKTTPKPAAPPQQVPAQQAAPPQIAPPQIAPPQIAPPQIAPPQIAPPQAAAPARAEIDPVPELLTRLVEREVELHALRAELAKVNADLEQARQVAALQAERYG